MFWALLLALLSAVPAHAQARAGDAVDRADALLAPLLKPGGGLAVVVARGGAILYERYAGLADVEHHVPVTASTRFQLASTSKQFTAAAALQLSLNGKLDLDGDIRRWLPELPDYGATVTVRDLMFHTSGIRELLDLEWLSGSSFHSVLTQQDVLKLLAGQKGLSFRPGTDFRYSNSNYALLATIVARASAQPFADYLRDHIFRPLGMTSTLVSTDIADVIADRAMSYQTAVDGKVEQDRLNYSYYGSTNVNATARDLLLWSTELMHPAKLSPGLIVALRGPGYLRNGQPLTYGYGLMIKPIAGRPAFQHTGRDAGYRAMLATFPQDDGTIVVLANDGQSISSLTASLAELFMGGHSDPTPKEVDVDDSWVHAQGRYIDDWGASFRLELKNGRLSAVFGNTSTPVQVVSDSEFYIGIPENRYTLAGRRLTTLSPLSGLPSYFRPITSVEPTPETLAGAAGVYRSDGLDVTYKIRPVDGRLIISILKGPDIILYPADVDVFEARDDDALDLRVTFERAKDGVVAGLRINTARSRGIAFRRISDGSARPSSDRRCSNGALFGLLDGLGSTQGR